MTVDTLPGVQVESPVTYEEVRWLPLVEPTYEVINGRLYMVPAPTPFHQAVAFRLARALDEFVAKRQLGYVLTAPCDVVLSQTDVLQPDVFFVSRERRFVIGEQNIWGAPDLVIEVLSPATQERDRIAKLAVYARYGVREYWLVDPADRTVAVLHWTASGYETAGVYDESAVLESPLLTDLRLPLAGVFEKL